MKLSGILKFVALAGVAAFLALSLVGCGSTISNTAFTQGNWAFVATSTAPKLNKVISTYVLGGNLSQSGNKLTGTLSVSNSGCISDQTLAFTGTVKGSDITLTSAAFDGNVISVTASGTKDSLTGNYTITGGCADEGTITAGAVPSLSGTWNGTLTPVFGRGNGISTVGVSVALVQSAAAAENGSFELTGTLTYTGTACVEPVALTLSSVAGSVVNISAQSGFGYSNVALDSITNPTSMTGDYDSTSDECSGLGSQTLVLTKQQ
ncbi:MAG: hypothetical protein HY010_17970 [Acidobacteria bacterium]|nr:hypothetical protein [Acidobacteriota bacterium]